MTPKINKQKTNNSSKNKNKIHWKKPPKPTDQIFLRRNFLTLLLVTYTKSTLMHSSTNELKLILTTISCSLVHHDKFYFFFVWFFENQVLEFHDTLSIFLWHKIKVLSLWFNGTLAFVQMFWFAHISMQREVLLNM